MPDRKRLRSYDSMVEINLQRFVLKDLKWRWFSAVYNLFPDEKENFDLSLIRTAKLDRSGINFGEFLF